MSNVEDAINDYEKEAVRRAGRAAGEFLISIGKDSLAMNLTKEEWNSFLATFLLDYEKQMKGLLERKTA